MTTRYVSSVDGNNNGLVSATWWNGSQVTYQTVAGALAGLTGGSHILYVDSAHAFTATAAITWAAATTDQLLACLSTNRATGARLAGASEAVGAANNTFNMSNANNPAWYLYGMSMSGSTNNNTASDISVTGSKTMIFDTCTIIKPSVNSGAVMLLGNNGVHSIYKDCTFSFPNTPNTPEACRIGGSRVEIINPTFSFGGTAPAFLFAASSAGTGGRVFVTGDLSAYNLSTGALVDASMIGAMDFVFKNIKYHSDVDVIGGTWSTLNGGSVTVINGDDGDTYKGFEYHNRLGTITQETSITLDGQAEFDTAPISLKIVTTSLCSEYEPFYCPWIGIWNGSTSSMTVALEVYHDSATDMNDRNLWSEIHDVTSASFPIGDVRDNRNAAPFDGTAVDWTNSSETWTGGGGFSNPNKQTIAQTFTPSEKSTHEIRLVVAEPSKTLYLNPNPLVS